MELSRSNSYAVHAYHSSDVRQAEYEAYLEQKLLRERIEEKRHLKAEIDTHIMGHKRSREVEAHGNRQTTVELILKQKHSPSPAPTRHREPLPLGHASTPFVAQQVAQDQHPLLSGQTNEPGDTHIFQSASQAYRDTRNLTISLMGFQGFREQLA
ncbi:hypothetical protein [Sneathiella glossodoripedis]|uniref:hypothetical protein n=1 Tax=Sneathiella glossodoripedis TaxID=418853 RepID=UPI000472C548|nr:hypothetical protein [Sneathiella glossodoripedis]